MKRECKIRRNRERFERNNECEEKEKRLKESIRCHKKNCPLIIRHLNKNIEITELIAWHVNK